MVRYLPHAMLATASVVVCPALAVWLLRTSGVVTSALIGMTVGVAVSLAASMLGNLYWTHVSRAEGVLFSDLMIWGWIRRWRAERRVTVAMARLSATTAIVAEYATGDGSGPDWVIDSRMRLLTQLAEALETGDPYTRGHSRRVARFAAMIAARMGLDDDQVELVRIAALLHDVGKINTPVEVLNKPGRLTDAEFETVKLHPVDGARLVAALGNPALTEMVLHHHERLDGRGYPGRLAGARIPLGARIIAVADTFDAITSARPYRPAGRHERALGVLVKESGTQLDADAVSAFRGCYSDRRSLAAWGVVTWIPERLTGWLGSANPAAALTVTKAVAAASAVAVVGGTAGAIAAPLRVSGRLAAPGSLALGAVATSTHASNRGAARGAARASGALAVAPLKFPSNLHAAPLRHHPSWHAPPSGPTATTAGGSSHPKPTTTSSSTTPVTTAGPVSPVTTTSPVTTVAQVPTQPATGGGGGGSSNSQGQAGSGSAQGSSGAGGGGAASGGGGAASGGGGPDPGSGSNTSGVGHGNGGGQGSANGSTSATGSTSANGSGSANGGGNGGANGNGHGNGAPSAGGTGAGTSGTSTTTTTTTTTTASPGNGNGNGHAVTQQQPGSTTTSTRPGNGAGNGAGNGGTPPGH